MHPENSELESQLRALPQPLVPPDLEARLMAAIPEHRPIRRRRRAMLAAIGSGLAAASLLIWLAWLARGPKSIAPVAEMPNGTGLVRDNSALAVGDDDTEITPRIEARRVLGGTETGIFAWPIEGPTAPTIATPIPADLLD
jgi:hypothetical protein